MMQNRGGILPGQEGNLLETPIHEVFVEVPTNDHSASNESDACVLAGSQGAETTTQNEVSMMDSEEILRPRIRRTLMLSSSDESEEDSGTVDSRSLSSSERDEDVCSEETVSLVIASKAERDRRKTAEFEKWKREAERKRREREQLRANAAVVEADQNDRSVPSSGDDEGSVYSNWSTASDSASVSSGTSATGSGQDTPESVESAETAYWPPVRFEDVCLEEEPVSVLTSTKVDRRKRKSHEFEQLKEGLERLKRRRAEYAGREPESEEGPKYDDDERALRHRLLNDPERFFSEEQRLHLLGDPSPYLNLEDKIMFCAVGSAKRPSSGTSSPMLEETYDSAPVYMLCETYDMSESSLEQSRESSRPIDWAQTCRTLQCGIETTLDGFAVCHARGACVCDWGSVPQIGYGVYFNPRHPLNVSGRIHGGRQANDRAEILAVISAIESAKSAGLEKLEIRSGSKFAKYFVEDWLPRCKDSGWETWFGQNLMNLNDMKRLDRALQQMEVRHVHVQEDDDDEEARELAEEGAKRS